MTEHKDNGDNDNDNHINLKKGTLSIPCEWRLAMFNSKSKSHQYLEISDIYSIYMIWNNDNNHDNNDDWNNRNKVCTGMNGEYCLGPLQVVKYT